MLATRFRCVVGLLAPIALVALATGCAKDDTASGKPASGKPGAGQPDKSASSPASPKSSGGPAASGGTGGSGGTSGTGSTGGSGGTGGGEPAKKPNPKTTGPTAPAPKKSPCADKPPTPDEVDPDEIALYGTEEIDDPTHLNLILQHGAWGCPGKDTDGAPFVTTGEEARWALDQAAYVSATTPITDSAENRRIGVQELVDWLAAHPNSGLVFKYQTGDDGAIHRLDQVFSP
ncbi:hypothetical protein [Streptomyces sp. XD-27]|uniref:hypothetical protein n=1 Tax=Streptomyces sp. XD-27 TaxID=3062779 RepID=UPI0026F40A12|nr:hypothetical protein [Streptomyces sp. XD-27]WKX73760.1 hypothetical protein Q3Y56_31280 [Streptomyces sp. XD-27]